MRQTQPGPAYLLFMLALSAASLVLLAVLSAAPLSPSAEDALWWSITTMTTVGYGDRFPITTEGRVVAVGLMACGIGLFGVLSGLMASWFVAPAGEKRNTELAALRFELQEIKQILAAGGKTPGR